MTNASAAQQRCGTISCVIAHGKGGITFENAWRPPYDKSALWLNVTERVSRTQAPMLDRPSDDEVSRQILGVFMRHSIPASGTLQRNDFFDVRDGDFQRGLNKAVANSWITIDLRNRYRYQLTAKGYAVGRMIDPVLGQPTNFVRA